MTSSITVFRAGAFTTESAPDWWEAEVAACTAQPSTAIGEDVCQHVWTWRLPVEHGHLAVFSDGSDGFEVWVPTTADLLTMLTGPAATYVTLREGPSIADSLADIRNTLISYCRHGGGEHIDRHGGDNHVDRQRDAEVRRRERAAEQARQAQVSGT